MQFNKDNIRNLAQQGWQRAEGNQGLTNDQIAFAIAEYIVDEIPAMQANSRYNFDTDSYVIDCHPVDKNLRSIRVTATNSKIHQANQSWRTISIDVQYLDPVEIKPHYDAIKQALKDDFEYAWGWHCNLAMPIVDTLGISHQDANRAAAALMQHMFGVDLTASQRYLDIIKQQELTPVENTLHVTITGFGENTGAEKLATHIYGWCHASGYKNTGISLADTTLANGQRSEKMPPTDTVIHITGVESRYHTDLHGAVTMPETAAMGTDDDVHDAPDVLDSAEGDGPKDGSYEEFGTAAVGDCFCGGFTPGKTTLNLELQETDANPLATIAYFRNAHPTADINVVCKVDHDLMVHIQQPQLPEVTPVTQGPEPTEHKGLVAIDKPAPSLSNTQDVTNAYVLGMEVQGELKIAVMYLDTNSTEFDIAKFNGSGITIVPADDIQALLEAQIPAALPYLSQLQVNNLRWARKYGDLQVEPEPVTESFSIYTIEQGAIPPSLYDTVEECWTCWQKSVDLPRLAEEIGDPTAIITLTDYKRIVKFGSVFLEHPRVEELFLTLLRKRAETNVQLANWLRAMRRL